MPVESRTSPIVVLRRDHPCRPVDWRWRKASALADAGRFPSRRRDDVWVANACRFLVELRRCQNDWDHEDVHDRYPTLYDAHYLRFSPDQAVTRAIIEARLLTGQDCRDIAWRLRCQPAIVEAYGRLHYDVFDKLADRDYILAYALGKRIYTGFEERDFGLMWKIMALGGGLPALDAAIDITLPLIEKGEETQALDWMRRYVKGSMCRRVVAAVTTLRPSDPLAKVQVFEADARYQIVEQQAEQSDLPDAQGDLSEAITEAVSQLSYYLGPEARKEGLKTEPHPMGGKHPRLDANDEK